MKNDIGINQRIPIGILEMALLSVLNGESSPEYFRQLASIEYRGQNRIGKAVSIINRLTIKNPLLPFIFENKDSIQPMLRNSSDRTLLFAAVICSAYGFGYNLVALLGKYFHTQEQVTTDLIRQKMSAKYGSNRSLPNALYCILPMLIEAGLIERPVPGIYRAKRIAKTDGMAYSLYHRAFLLNNPTYSDADDVESNAFFEFITDKNIIL